MPASLVRQGTRTLYICITRPLAALGERPVPPSLEVRAQHTQSQCCVNSAFKLPSAMNDGGRTGRCRWQCDPTSALLNCLSHKLVLISGPYTPMICRVLCQSRTVLIAPAAAMPVRATFTGSLQQPGQSAFSGRTKHTSIDKQPEQSRKCPVLSTGQHYTRSGCQC